MGRAKKPGPVVDLPVDRPETPQEAPAPDVAPGFLDRLKARQEPAQEAAEPSVDPVEATSRARENLIRQLSVTEDPEDIKKLSAALVALDRVATVREEREKKPDFSAMSDEEFQEFRRLAGLVKWK